MPTFLDKNGVRFFVYSNDHEPAHVHAEYGDGVAKIQLEPIQLVEADDLSSAERRHILKVAKANARELIDAWNLWWTSRAQP